MMITQATKLSWLVREMRRTRGQEWLSALPIEVVQPLLFGVVATAKWIATVRPELLQQDRLSIAVGGGEYDLVDHGAFWSLIDSLLNKPRGWSRIDLIVPADTKMIVEGIAPRIAQSSVSVIRADEPRDVDPKRQATWDLVTIPTAVPLALTASLDQPERSLWPALENGASLLFGLRRRWEAWLFEGCSLCCGLSQGVIESPLSLSLAPDEDAECAFLCWVNPGERPGDIKTMQDRLWWMEDLKTVVEDLAFNWKTSPVARAFHSGEMEDFRQWGTAALLKSSLDNSDTYVSLPNGHALRTADGTIHKIENDLKVHGPMHTRLDGKSLTVQDVQGCSWVGPAWWAASVWHRRLKAEVEGSLGGMLEQRGGATNADLRILYDTIARQAGFSDEKREAFVAATTGGAPYAPQHDERMLFAKLHEGKLDEAMSMVRTHSALANAMDERRRPLLLVLAELGAIDQMGEAIRLGADVLANDGGMRPIVAQMAWVAPKAAVELLLDCGADINAYDPLGWTALQVAISAGKWDTCSMLLDRGASANWGEAVGRTAKSMVQGVRSGKDAKSMHENLEKIHELSGVDIKKSLRDAGFTTDHRDIPTWLRDKILECPR